MAANQYIVSETALRSALLSELGPRGPLAWIPQWSPDWSLHSSLTPRDWGNLTLVIVTWMENYVLNMVRSSWHAV